MLSKNNFKERLRKMEPKKERFSIRKFSVGATSVLIGFFYMGMSNGQSVKADVQPNAEKIVEVQAPKSDEQASAEATIADKVADAVEPTVEAESQENSIKEDANKKASTKTVDAKTTTDQDTATKNQNQTADQKSESKNADLNQNQQINNNAVDAQSTDKAEKRLKM